MNNNVVVKNVCVWNGESFNEPSVLRISNGIVVDNDLPNALEFDADGALAIPALFGLGLDFQEPHRDDVYTFKNGFNAMQKGGFYGGLYESNANPIDDGEKLSAIKKRLEGHPFEIELLGAYSVGFGSSSLSEMLELSSGVVGFGDGNAPIPSTRFLRLAMEYGKMTGKRFFFLPLDKALRKSGCVHEGAYSDMLGMKGIPRIAETITAFTVLETARFLQVPVHFKQVTCGETIELIKNAKQSGLDVTCDVDIYHLLFDDSSLESLNAAFHLVPPLRAALDKEALFKGLEEGVIDAISVNHFPVLLQDTEVNFEDSVPGAISLEIALPAIWNELSLRFGFKKAIELLSYAPARIAHARKAEITLGKRTDFVLLKEHAPHSVLANELSGHVQNTPLLNKVLPSTILGSCIGGNFVLNH